MSEELEVMETEVDDSVDEELADLEETEEEITEEEGEEVEQDNAYPEKQSAEQNSVFANMRRRAEADAQRKVDNRIAALCKDVVHPITGKPITNFEEYEDAIAAQSRIQTEETLRQNGLDISVLDEYVKTSPVLAKAQAIIEQNEQNQAAAMLNNDFAELQKLNTDIQTFSDLASDPRFGEIINKVRMGANLVEAYKIVNFDVLMERGTKGAKQSAINQARGKSHLEPTETIADSSDNSISDKELAILRNNFPEKSDKEIRKLYKQTFKK